MKLNKKQEEKAIDFLINEGFTSAALKTAGNVAGGAFKNIASNLAQGAKKIGGNVATTFRTEYILPSFSKLLGIKDQEQARTILNDLMQKYKIQPQQSPVQQGTTQQTSTEQNTTQTQSIEIDLNTYKYMIEKIINNKEEKIEEAIINFKLINGVISNIIYKDNGNTKLQLKDIPGTMKPMLDKAVANRKNQTGFFTLDTSVPTPELGLNFRISTFPEGKNLIWD